MGRIEQFVILYTRELSVSRFLSLSISRFYREFWERVRSFRFCTPRLNSITASVRFLRIAFPRPAHRDCGRIDFKRAVTVVYFVIRSSRIMDQYLTRATRRSSRWLLIKFSDPRADIRAERKPGTKYFFKDNSSGNNFAVPPDIENLRRERENSTTYINASTWVKHTNKNIEKLTNKTQKQDVRTVYTYERYIRYRAYQ